MTDRDPIRLIDDEAEPDARRRDLQRASKHDVGYDVAAGLAVFETSLLNLPPAGVEAAPGSAAAASGGSVLSGKLLLMVVGVVAVVGVGVVALPSGDDRPTPTAARAQPDPRPAIVPEPPIVDRAPLPEVVAPQPELEPTPPVPEVEEDPPESESSPQAEPPRAKRPRGNEPTTASPTPSIDILQAEMDATDRARKALASNPARARQLARAADAEFKDGMFGEQRAGIAALAGLAIDPRDPDAAQAYLRKYPKGTYADKVREALAQKP